MERSLGISIKKASNAIARNADSFAHSLGLTGVQIGIIDYIFQNEKERAIFQKDIEKEFNIRRSTATSALKLMEARELLVRVPLLKDARMKQILLTHNSKILEGKIHCFFQATEEEMESALGSAEAKLLQQQLLTLTKSLVH
ncbi:MarR family winged helix-turn-helix transcriptional regulator [Liquorilactobacillus satsumensis]|uniref:HTH marR-type domain-containing protein n=1 Tax=Liquorilactobacillus satsumensis DSM 16230 = JCM 12392 TaxID=1423801 RepID=A0A0R1V0H9_9LACO|nr:helix-turn-helix domain-containing protein [Liquorilactobacillus satsumensis]KRL96744.1 hypothetical protein FD50_GL002023 [Liquorilactobacillus satsumensis DSM 16230 = JCM 12392]MCC7666090.1 MarR family transcriptional regulator [Liquorilactobacillus satsumensis]MCP9312544.1 MarR family transcriptional regulator [Liquorilactobacillus satsumensis]MCP9328847.1 MarR family transcriptional regulator [Liquorilactobacillus satsumensis]MCP9356803.1 MarR family transcriptional regulator [Liquorila